MDQDLKTCCSWVRRCFILLTFATDLGCMILIVVPILPPLLSSTFKDVPLCILLKWFLKLRFVASFNETPSHCQKRWDCSLPGSEGVSHRSMSTVWACPSPLLISQTQCAPSLLLIILLFPPFLEILPFLLYWAGLVMSCSQILLG